MCEGDLKNCVPGLIIGQIKKGDTVKGSVY
jgi:hypothetical protein